MRSPMADQPVAYEGWAIIEQYGHRRLAGYVRPVSMYGADMARVDIPQVDDQPARTQYIGGSSIYGLHPCDEAIALVAAKTMPEPPVSRWELRAALPAPASDGWIEVPPERDDEDPGAPDSY